MRQDRTIRTAAGFRRVCARGRRVRRDGLTVYAERRDDPEAPTRLGLAVPVRPHGAVARNRTRRQLRAAFGGCAPERGYDVVVRAEPSLYGRKFQEMRDDLAAALAEACR